MYILCTCMIKITNNYNNEYVKKKQTKILQRSTNIS